MRFSILLIASFSIAGDAYVSVSVRLNANAKTERAACQLVVF